VRFLSLVSAAAAFAADLLPQVRTNVSASLELTDAWSLSIGLFGKPNTAQDGIGRVRRRKLS
jgi:hypothetical protein